MNLQDLHCLLPELILLSLTALLLVVGLFSGRKQSGMAYGLTQCILILSLLSLTWQHQTTTLYALHHMFVLSPLTTLAKAMTLLCAIFSLAYAKKFFNEHPTLTYDYCLLFLFSTLGMLCLISSNHLLPLYLSLELLSLPLFALTAIAQTGNTAEAAMKYFALGAIASALLLYGFSLIYGATGSLWLDPITTTHPLLITAAIIFIVASFAYKFGAAPFHLWAPDVYEGAPIAVVNFLGNVPKIAVLIILIRLFDQTLINFISHWQSVWIVIAVASMALGNIAAIIQTNIRRLLAYSAIAHMGYLLLGFISGTTIGFSASLFYVFAYALMTLAAFGAIMVLGNQGFAIEHLEDLRGLNNKNPWLAFMLLVVMFSMAGIPPSIGFFAKLGVLQALIGAQLTWLSVVALIFAIIGAYYYIRVVKIMYFEPLEDNAPIYTGWFGKTILSIMSLSILLLGIFPNALIEKTNAVFFKHEIVIAGQTYACSIGRGGIRADKHEGDGATPVGTFPIRRIFYRADRINTTYLPTTLPVTALTPNDGWCDDAQDPEHYNQYVPLPFSGSHENLWHDDHVYDVILVVGYNDAPAQPGKGSAIFIHIAREGYQPTAGCIALKENDLLNLLPHLTNQASVTIAANGMLTLNE